MAFHKTSLTVNYEDATVMATLAAPIAESFNSLSLLAWLATAYLIGVAATQPISGKLTDIYSRRAGLLTSSILFAAGNLLCGFAREEWTMIAGRVVAGLGGGALNTIGTIVISDLVPLRRRGFWQGIGNLFWGVGNGLGGIFGGFVNDTWDWRYAFLAQVPLTLLSMLIMFFYLDRNEKRSNRIPEPSASATSRVDFLGSFLSVTTMSCLLLGLTAGGNIVPWSHPLVYVSLILAVISLAAFIGVEEKVAREPILSLHFLKDRTVLCSCLTSWSFHLTLYTMLFYTPIFYRIRGVSTAKAGASLIPLSFTFALGSFSAGIITLRTGKYRFLLQGTLIVHLLGAVVSTTYNGASPLWTPLIVLALVGFAFGGMLTVTFLAFTSAVEPEDQAVVTSLSYVFRSTGSVVGLTLASTIFQNVLDNRLHATLGYLANAEDIIKQIRNNLDAVNGMPMEIQRSVKASYMLALRSTFGSTVAFAIFALTAGLLIRELKLHSTLARSDQQGDDPERPDVKKTNERA